MSVLEVPPPVPEATFSRARVPYWKPGLLILLGVATLLICRVSRPSDTKPTSGVNMDLPVRVGVWWGEETPVSAAELRILPKDTTFARRTYEDGMGDRILCSIVLSGADARSIHRPERCLPGQGWTIGGSQTLPIELEDGRLLNVQALDLMREVKIADGEMRLVRSIYIYWFVGDAFTTNSNLERVARGVLDRVFLNRQHRWAYIICSSRVTEGMSLFGKNRQQTLEMLKGFIAEIGPKMLTQETLGNLPEQ